MQRLWAPWRSTYLKESNASKQCFLCFRDETLIVGEKAHAFVIMNRFPYTNGHVMVAPKRHVSLLGDLTEEEVVDLFALLKAMEAVYKEVMRAEGLNIGMNMGRAAGAGLEHHLHIHMVPRWVGDTNFMPLLAETKVISEHIEETLKRLKEGLERIL